MYQGKSHRLPSQAQVCCPRSLSLLIFPMPDLGSDRFNFARDVFEQWAKQRPDSLALWCVHENGASECKLTFSQLTDKLRRAAGFFHQLGLRSGDRVLVITRKIPEWWIAMLGLIRLGVVP